MSTADQFEPKLPGPCKRPFYEFGPYLLDTIQHVLLKEGRALALTPKTYDTLCCWFRTVGECSPKKNS